MLLSHSLWNILADNFKKAILDCLAISVLC